MCPFVINYISFQGEIHIQWRSLPSFDASYLMRVPGNSRYCHTRMFLKEGRVNQSKVENTINSDLHYFLIEVMPTLVKRHKTSFNVFPKHRNA